MKKVILLILIYSNISTACDQKLYDSLYRAIIKDALETPVECSEILVHYKTKKGVFSHTGCITNEKKISDDRNRAIRFLRKLCNGQLSSYERLKQ